MAVSGFAVCVWKAFLIVVKRDCQRAVVCTLPHHLHNDLVCTESRALTFFPLIVQIGGLVPSLGSVPPSLPHHLHNVFSYVS